MRVILDERAAEVWMHHGERDPFRLKSLLVPVPDDWLVLSSATSLVNRVENDRPELLVPNRTLPMQRSLL
jgi:putative SOS response-associated peptidase YedK